MDTVKLLFLFAAMGLVTYLPRWLPLVILNNRTMPRWLVEWLDLIPVSILSALLLPTLIVGGTPRHLQGMTPDLLVAVPTFWFAFRFKSLGGTVVLWMFLYWLCGRIL